MTLYDLFCYKQSYAKTGKCLFFFAPGPVKTFKYFFVILFINANTKILHTYGNPIFF